MSDQVIKTAFNWGRHQDFEPITAIEAANVIVLASEIDRLRSWLGHIGASTQDADVLGDTVRALRGDDPPATEGDDTGETTRAA